MRDDGGRLSAMVTVLSPTSAPRKQASSDSSLSRSSTRQPIDAQACSVSSWAAAYQSQPSR